MWPQQAAFVYKQDRCRILLWFDSVSRYVDKQIVFKWHLSAYTKYESSRIIGAIIVPTALFLKDTSGLVFDGKIFASKKKDAQTIPHSPLTSTD